MLEKDKMCLLQDGIVFFLFFFLYYGIIVVSLHQQKFKI